MNLFQFFVFFLFFKIKGMQQETPKPISNESSKKTKEEVSDKTFSQGHKLIFDRDFFIIMGPPVIVIISLFSFIIGHLYGSSSNNQKQLIEILGRKNTDYFTFEFATNPSCPMMLYSAKIENRIDITHEMFNDSAYAVFRRNSVADLGINVKEILKARGKDIMFDFICLEDFTHYYIKMYENDHRTWKLYNFQKSVVFDTITETFDCYFRRSKVGSLIIMTLKMSYIEQILLVFFVGFCLKLILSNELLKKDETKKYISEADGIYNKYKNGKIKKDKKTQ